MTLTGDRALRFARAADRNLDYVPGEVLVKFNSGATDVEQQRALMALRSRPTVAALHWIGDVALFRDPTEADSTILAAQLSTQPEVAYAEPNYLRHRNSTPDDPAFLAPPMATFKPWICPERGTSIPAATIQSL